MIGEITGYAGTPEGANATRTAEAADADYISGIYPVSEAIKRSKSAQLEMARLTQQAVEAMECLTQRIGCQPSYRRGSRRQAAIKQAGNQ